MSTVPFRSIQPSPVPPDFSDTGFERFKYFQIFWDFSKNKKSQPLAELIEMVQYLESHIS